MNKLLPALVWCGMLIGATSGCSYYCYTCSSGICTSCSYSSLYSTSQQDCVETCSGYITYYGNSYGAQGTCNDSTSTIVAVYIIVPIVVVLFIIVCGVCFAVARRRRFARMNSMRYFSAQSANQSLYLNQNIVSAGFPMVQVNPPGYQEGMYQPGIQQVVLPQMGGYDQSGFPIQGGDAPFAYQAQPGFNQGGYANAGYQGQVVDMQPYYQQQQQQVNYQQQQQQQPPQYYQQGYAGQNPILEPVKM